MSETKDCKGNVLRVGDAVKVYHLIGGEDYKCDAIIRDIREMNSESGMMCWLDGVRGAWHPRALIRTMEAGG